MDASIVRNGRDKVKGCIVIGGSRNCDYFMDKLEAKLGFRPIGATNSSVGQPHPVAIGALWAFGMAKERSVPRTDTFGTHEDQPLDVTIHPEYFQGPGSPEDTMARYRWRTLVAPGAQGRTSLWQYREVPADADDILQQLYHAPGAREEHSAVYRGHDGVKTMPGIEKWGSVLRGKLPDLQAAGFEVQYRSARHMKPEEGDGDDDNESSFTISKKSQQTLDATLAAGPTRPRLSRTAKASHQSASQSIIPRHEAPPTPPRRGAKAAIGQ